jgi:hypothetical protein
MIWKRGAKTCLEIEPNLSEQRIADIEENGGWPSHGHIVQRRC